MSDLFRRHYQAGATVYQAFVRPPGVPPLPDNWRRFIAAREDGRALDVTDTEHVVGPVYIAGPITPTDGRTLELNLENAIEAFAFLSRRRVAAVCVHLAAELHDDQIDAIDYETWMAVDFRLLEACRAVLVLPGFATSPGTMREIAHADRCKIPAFYAYEPLFQALGVGARLKA